MHLAHDQVELNAEVVLDRCVVVVDELFVVRLLLLLAVTSASRVDRAVVLLDFDPAEMMRCRHDCRICRAIAAACSAC